MATARLNAFPADDSIQQPEIEYTKKARHGHGQDVVDENNIRQVAGCLPIDPVNKRFLLVSSRKRPGAWVIPKGGWEQDETQEHAALRETWEEAGIKGRIIRHIGVFEERNKHGVKAHHWIYELEIQEVVEKFPERKKRERRWFTFDEALLATKSAYLHDAIRMSSLNPALHEQQQPSNTPPSPHEPVAQQQPDVSKQQPPPHVEPSTSEPQPPAKKPSLGAQLKSLFSKKS